MANPKDLTKERALIKGLIKTTNALNASEKKYWQDLLPNMNETQLAQLKGILQKEQKNLDEIDDKYGKKLENIAQKTIIRWDNEKSSKARVKRQTEEKSHQKKAYQQAEKLLRGW